MRRWKATGTFIGTDEEDSQTIAYVSDARNRRQWSDEEELAYAHLIAAAPELLGRLKQAIERLEVHEPESILVELTKELIERLEG